MISLNEKHVKGIFLFLVVWKRPSNRWCHYLHGYSLTSSLLKIAKQDIDRKRDNHQYNSQSDSKAELTFAGFQGDRGGYRSGIIPDVAPEHYCRAHLADDSAESRNNSGHDGKPGFVQDRNAGLHPVSAEGKGSQSYSPINPLHGCNSKRGNYGNSQDKLANNHRGWRKENTQKNRTGPVGK